MGTGRDKELINKRNAKLIKRLQYWTEVRRLRFDDAIRILSQEEFFISEERILNILRSDSNIKDDKPCRNTRYPRLTLKQLKLLTDKDGDEVAIIKKMLSD